MLKVSSLSFRCSSYGKYSWSESIGITVTYGLKGVSPPEKGLNGRKLSGIRGSLGGVAGRRFLYGLALFVDGLVLSGTVGLHYCQVVDDEFDSPLPPDVRVQT